MRVGVPFAEGVVSQNADRPVRVILSRLYRPGCASLDINDADELDIVIIDNPMIF